MLDSVAVSVLALVLGCWPGEAAGCAAGLREGSLAQPLPVPVGRSVYGQPGLAGSRGACGQAVLARSRKGFACLCFLREVETASDNLQGHNALIQTLHTLSVSYGTCMRQNALGFSCKSCIHM